MIESIEISYFVSLCKMMWHKNIKKINFAEYYMV